MLAGRSVISYSWELPPIPMAKESSQTNRSLPLHEVLEQEFAQLHGAFPRDASPTRPATTDERLKAYNTAVHGLREKQMALCLSGGGIRSATFALGILQGLARCGLLRKFHYLSTVSGGGYIGGWLTAWIHNAKGGISEVAAELAQPRGETRPNPEPQQIRNLRSYSNYLTPKLGFLSADAWTLAGTYLRNLLLTWFVILPLLAAVLAIPRIYTSVLMQSPPPYTYAPLVIAALCVAMCVAYMGLNLPCGGNRRWNQNRFLLFCLLPMLIAAILITNEWAWWRYYERPLLALQFFGVTGFHTSYPFIIFGVLMHVLSWIFSLYRTHGFRWMEFLAVVVSGGSGGWLLWLGATKIYVQPVAKAELYTCFAVPLVLAFFFLAIMVFAGISSRWTVDADREWWGRATGWFLALACGWIVISSLVVFGPVFLSWTAGRISTLAAGAASAALTILASRSSAIPANEKQQAKAGPLGLLLSKATTLAALIFVVVLIILLTEGTSLVLKTAGNALKVPWNLNGVSAVVGRKVEYLNVILYTPIWLITATALGLAGLGLAMAYLINTNKFSLHAMYRDRLIRAYLGASNNARDPNPFTGFDEADNVSLRDLWSPGKFEGRLLPVINIALNLVGGGNLAWQQRKAANFTMTPLHCGSYEVGYRPTTGPEGQRYGGDAISLGTAITISGAAASPNMGYHSSPLVTFILTLLNVRLGAWLGNPGPAGDRTFSLELPELERPPDYRRSLWAIECQLPLCLPIGWRTLRKPRPLRDGAAPLSLHCGERRRAGSRVFIHGSRRRGAQDSHRPRDLDRVRRDRHSWAR